MKAVGKVLALVLKVIGRYGGARGPRPLADL